MENYYLQLNVVEVDPTLYRVECRLTHQVVGYLAKGELLINQPKYLESPIPVLTARSLWFVFGREREQIFNSANESLHALRDYWLTQRIALQQEVHLAKNDRMLALTNKKSVKQVMPELIKKVRKERREIRLKQWLNKVYGGLVR